MSYRIIQLSPNEWRRLKAIRLKSLLEAPYAFGSTYEYTIQLTDDDWQDRFADIPSLIAEWQDALGQTSDVGMVRYAPSRDDKNDAYLISMWVDPDYRRKQIGVALIESVLKLIQESGFKRVLLDVAKGNDAARKLYQRMGFKETGEVSQLRGNCEYRMVKVLD